MFHPIFRKHRPHREEPHTRPIESYMTRRRGWIIASFSLCVMAISLGYYFLVHLPVEARERLRVRQDEAAMQERLEGARLEAEQERQIRWEKSRQQLIERNASERELQAYQLDMCINDSEQTYVLLWDRECAVRGLGQDCRLDDAASETLNTHLKDLKDECFKRYPQLPAGTTDEADET